MRMGKKISKSIIRNASEIIAGFAFLAVVLFVMFIVTALFGCSDNCTHKETDCDNDRIQLCDASGDWETVKNCKSTEQECIIDTEGDPICVD